MTIPSNPCQESSMEKGTASARPSPVLELTPLVQQESKRLSVLRVALLGSLMITVSAALINYNKYLMSSGKFAFATHLVMCHMGSGTIFTCLTLLVAPSLFPSLGDPSKRALIDAPYIFCRVLPIAVFFAASLVLSNTAYLYASVAFLQMMKEANVVIVYGLSVIVGLEFFKTRNVAVLLFIVACTVMTVSGEVDFSMRGTLIQASCQLFEASRLVLQSILLSGGLKLDALTYNIIVMPLCFCVLSCMIGVESVYPGTLGFAVPMPTQADFLNNWKLLLPNCLLAFGLNIIVALFIKYSSAITMVLTSLIKDMFVVVCSVAFMHETISEQQTIFFGLQLSGIFTWSMLKTFPAEFERGIIPGFRSLLFSTIKGIKGKT